MEKKNRLYGFDLARIISLMLILIYHLNGILNDNPIPVCGIGNGELGAVGVGLFILISGSMITYTYNGNACSFYAKRLKKIFIPFWVTYIIVLVCELLQGRFVFDLPLYKFLLTFIGMDGFFSYLTSTYYLVGEWFLGFIIMIYIVYPVVHKIMDRFPLALIFVSFIVEIYMVNNYQWDIPFLWNPFVLAPFLLLGVYFIKKYDNMNSLDTLLIGFALLISSQLFQLPGVLMEVFFKTIGLYLILVILGNKIILRCNSRIQNAIMLMSELTFGVILIHHRVIFTLERILIGEDIELNKYILLVIVTIVSFIFSYLLRLLVKNIDKPAEGIKRIVGNAVNKIKLSMLSQNKH